MMRAADICLLLEGTYPYVRGGVSSWVHELLRGMPERTFALVYLGSTRDRLPPRAYELPDNVVSLEETMLFDPPPLGDLHPRALPAIQRRELARRLHAIYLTAVPAERAAAFGALTDWLLEAGSNVRAGHLIHGREGWDLLHRIYSAQFADVSFPDFFWTCRFIHHPLWNVVESLRRAPVAGVYHAISTGYAGALGALAARRHHRPFVVTEHGIYIKERLIEIAQSTWIHEPRSRHFLGRDRPQALKRIWASLFLFLGQLAYASADPIITLSAGNARLQREFGAPAARQRIIANGIDPDAFAEARRVRRGARGADPARYVVGFIGRIVSIKDVKTLIRAARFVIGELPHTRFLLFGPESEEPRYAQECRQLASSLRLADHLTFAGSQPIPAILPQIDVLALTSVSEAQPLVILEAFAAEVPVVSTDVGACRELVEGRDAEDRCLGPAGMVTDAAAPRETADALVTLGRDRALQDRLGAAGLARVSRFYDQRATLGAYRDVYEQLLAKP